MDKKAIGVVFLAALMTSFLAFTPTVPTASACYPPKRFTCSNGFGGFAPPAYDDLTSTVVGLHSGPRIHWHVTYYVENTAAFLGSQYDGNPHYFILWDKWGGNLMALDSCPTGFDPVTNVVTLANGVPFDINPRLESPLGYRGYIGDGRPLAPSKGTAMITLHKGDQQEGTNPGKGNGATKDGRSYDADVRWDIGLLAPGASATLDIRIAPGKNPGGVLMFSESGTCVINTGPRIRVYADAAFTDFLYAVDNTVQLTVIVND